MELIDAPLKEKQVKIKEIKEEIGLQQYDYDLKFLVNLDPGVINLFEPLANFDALIAEFEADVKKIDELPVVTGEESSNSIQPTFLSRISIFAQKKNSMAQDESNAENGLSDSFQWGCCS